MQVSVETTGALERRMTVQVPAERVDQEVENRLKSLARTARLDGFRPGKVPFKVVKKKFGPQVYLEVATDVMNTSLQDALTQEQLRPAGGPKVEPQTVEMGKALEYTATFEVYPEFEPADLADAELERIVCEIQDSDIDDMIDKLRRQRVEWETVERAAAEGDQVTIDFQGTIDGAKFEGGAGASMPIELGSNSLIEGFESGLVGASAGDERTLDLTFPENYGKQDLAGKPVQFAVTVKSVAEAKLPELDDEFASAFGVAEGGVDALRAEIRKNMQRELDQTLLSKNKDKAFELLLDRNPIEVPAALIEDEAERLMKDATESVGQAAQGKTLPKELFMDQARKRVTLGLVVGEIISRNEIQPDADRMRAKVEAIASSYEDPSEVIKWYQGNQEAMSNVQAMVMEEQVVDWILDQAKVDEKPSTFEEIMGAR